MCTYDLRSIGFISPFYFPTKHILSFILQKAIPKLFTIPLISYTTSLRSTKFLCAKASDPIASHVICFKCTAPHSCSCMSCCHFNMNSVANLDESLWWIGKSIHLDSKVAHLALPNLETPITLDHYKAYVEYIYIYIFYEIIFYIKSMKLHCIIYLTLTLCF